MPLDTLAVLSAGSSLAEAPVLLVLLADEASCAFASGSSCGAVSSGEAGSVTDSDKCVVGKLGFRRRSHAAAYWRLRHQVSCRSGRWAPFRLTVGPRHWQTGMVKNHPGPLGQHRLLDL